MLYEWVIPFEERLGINVHNLIRRMAKKEKERVIFADKTSPPVIFEEPKVLPIIYVSD